MPNGQIEEISINENREVFVNGRNITTITHMFNSPILNKNRINSYTEEWTSAGYFDYKYNLAGLTLSGTYAICRGLGLSISKSAFTSIASNYIVGVVLQSGVYIRDRRHTYYKNINKQRPDMKEEHEVHFVAEILNFSYEEYLGGFTTYGGI